MKKGILLFVLILCLAIPLAFAIDVVVKPIPRNYTIIQDSNQYASYDVLIHNPFSYEDTFELNVRDYTWNVWSSPFADYVGGGVDIPPESNYTAHLFLKPLSRKPLGRYNVPLYVKSKMSGATYTTNLIVDIISGIPPLREYAIGIVASVSMPRSIDPRESAEMTVFVENLYPRNITGLKLVVSSQLIKTETTFDLEPLGKKVLKFPLQFSPNTPPLTDTVKFIFYKDNQSIKQLETHYSIEGYSNVIKKGDELEKGFLRYTRHIQLYNDGNIPTRYKLSIKSNPLQRLFIRTTPSHYIVKNQNGTFMVWDLSLEPKATTDIVVTQNYTPLFWLGVAVLIILLFYLFMRSPLVITKEAKVLEVKDGAISELKVLLHLKNRTKKSLMDIRIADRVPHIATVDKEFDIGTIKPDKIVKDSRGGTLIKWTIPCLEPYEERIISYRIKSRLQVLGGFVLPSAMAKFKTPGGAELKTKSNLGKLFS
ncbi:hypothetical protein DRJ48_04670 [Candidatus Woesearchaeota archaeon]|nr:hypothetical protein [Candidatus Woesearchaeota archaeon]RLE41886.1 MAG: hypothetical protein DRJ48_04670 [Candidatus Woesearchaeota archaeon]